MSMVTIGVRELRQNASEILRNVAQASQLWSRSRDVRSPIRADQWTTWERVGAVFESPTDPGWDAERREFGALGLDDPWTR
jgi:hypothetical protein